MRIPDNKNNNVITIRIIDFNLEDISIDNIQNINLHFCINDEYELQINDYSFIYKNLIEGESFVIKDLTAKQKQQCIDYAKSKDKNISFIDKFILKIRTFMTNAEIINTKILHYNEYFQIAPHVINIRDLR